LEHPQRKTVAGRTFAPGADTLCNDPEGKRAVNTWRDVPHVPPKDWQRRAKPFTEHVTYLVPERDELEQLMLWLAHLAQRPGDMPPWHVVMFTEGRAGRGPQLAGGTGGRGGGPLRGTARGYFRARGQRARRRL
jgi:hypothetical protein